MCEGPQAGEEDQVDVEDLRLFVYRAFAAEGRAPDVASLAHLLDVQSEAVVAGLRQLARAHHLVLDENDRVLMAHPFSAVPLGFAAMGAGTLWWGGCAWDSFAIAHLLPGELRSWFRPSARPVHGRTLGCQPPRAAAR